MVAAGNSKSAPPSIKATGHKNRRTSTFKRSMPTKLQKRQARTVSKNRVFHGAQYFHLNDVVSVTDKTDGQQYFAVIRSLLQNEFLESFAQLSWVLPKIKSSVFNVNDYALGPDEDVLRTLDCLTFVCPGSSHLKVVFNPGEMFPSQNAWNGETNDLASSVMAPNDYQASSGFEHLQDAANQSSAAQLQPSALTSVAHVFKQQPDDATEYVPEAKRLAYAPSPFVNKSPGSPYCENGSISSPMSVAAASSLDAYHQGMQSQHHQIDSTNFEQSGTVSTNDLACATPSQIQPGQYSAEHFNALSPFGQQHSTGHALGQNPMLSQPQQPELNHGHSSSLGAHSNINQLATYPPMSNSPRNYLTPSPIGSADSSTLAASSALGRYGTGAPLYPGQGLTSQPSSRPLSPVVFSDLAQRHLSAAQFPSHYLPTGLPAVSAHQMSSMPPHPSQFAPPQSPHGLAPGSLMRMGFPYRYPPSPYFDFRSGHPPSPYHPYQLSNGPNAPPFFRDEFIKPGRKPASPGSVYPQMQSNEVITLADVCEMKDPDDLSKIALSNADELLAESNGSKEMATRVLEIESRLCFSLLNLRLSDPVMYIYNPLDYARQIHQTFVLKWGSRPKRVLFLGMNPGPFGMAQNGIPFGDGQFVKNFLKMEKGVVSKPSREHPKRPIWGLECPQREVSGSRFWSLVQSISGHPDAFFDNCYVYNYCPLVFLGMSGKNITPPSLGSSAREPLLQACDKALVDVVNLMGIEKIVAVGRFVEERSKLVLKTANREDVEVIFIMHPSPINPKANAGWESIVKGQLEEAKIAHFFPHFYNPIPVTFSTTAANGPTNSTSTAGSQSSGSGCKVNGDNTTTKVSTSKPESASCVVTPNQNLSNSACEKLVNNCDSAGAIQGSNISCKQEAGVSHKQFDNMNTRPQGPAASLDPGLSGNQIAHGTKQTPPSLVGQLSIASEASTFADEFIKAEVTITSNSVAAQNVNCVANQQQQPPQGMVKPDPDHLSSHHPASQMRSSNCERSAIDHLIASTQAQQQSLNLPIPHEGGANQSNQQQGASQFSAGTPQNTFQQASQGQTDNTNSATSSNSHNHISALDGNTSNLANNTTANSTSAINPQSQNMLMQQHSQSDANNIVTQQQQQNSAAFAFQNNPSHKLGGSSPGFQTNPIPGSGPQLQSIPLPHPGAGFMGYGNTPHIMANPSAHYGFGGPQLGAGSYATGADLYSSAPLYSPHLMPPHFGNYPMSMGAAGVGTAGNPPQHFAPAAPTTSSPQNLLDNGTNANLTLSNQTMRYAAPGTPNGNAATTPGMTNTFFSQTTNTNASQFDCYAPTSNLLS